MASLDVQKLLSGDGPAFEQLVQLLLSPQNEQRSAAEQVFNQVKTHPDLCVSQLLAILRRSPDEQSRALCAVLLRKV